MNYGISSSELYAAATVLLYGGFSVTKHALCAGDAAYLYILSAAVLSLSGIIAATLLPSVQTAAAVIPTVLGTAYLLYSAIINVRSGGISLWVCIVLTLALVGYGASKGVGTAGRVCTLFIISGAAVLLFMLAVFARYFDFSLLKSGFSDTDTLLISLLYPLYSVYTIYLMKGFFYVPVKDRAAKPPVAESVKHPKKRLFAVLFAAWATAGVFAAAVTVFSLSLAPSALYAKSARHEVFAAGLLPFADFTPFISICVFLFTLCMSLCALSACASIVGKAIAKAKER